VEAASVVAVAVVAAAAAVAEVIAIDAQNQAISHVIVLNQIHVEIPINKVMMMIIR